MPGDPDLQRERYGEPEPTRPATGFGQPQSYTPLSPRADLNVSDPTHKTPIIDAAWNRLVDNYLTNTLPGALDYLEDPAVLTIVRQAARNNWSQDQLLGALTPILGAYAGANGGGGGGGGRGRGGGGGGGGGGVGPTDIASIKAELKNQAGVLGIPLTDEQLTHMATFGAQNRYTAAQYTDALMDIITATTELDSTGTIVNDRSRIKAEAGQWLTKLSDETINNYADRIARGEMNPQGVTEILRQQAKARFAYLSPLIDQGVTLADYFAPTKDIVAQTLEVSSDSIDLTDPKWSNLLEVRDDKGNVRAATLGEAERMARKRPEYAQTNAATNLAAAYAVKLRNMMTGG